MTWQSEDPNQMEESVKTPTEKSFNLRKWLSAVFSDRTLTKKAYLNAIASALDYLSRLIIGFLVTPLLVSGLGDFYYGVWQVIIRFMSYLTPASGRSVQALKMTLANQHLVADADQKKEYVGSTFIVWLIFLPVTAILGGIVSWFMPIWLKAGVNAYSIIRIAAAIMVLNVVMTSLSNLPRSVMEGENLGYKRMGASALLVILGGGFTWMALILKTGLVGVSLAALLITLITGIFFFGIVKNYSPWFGYKKSSAADTRQFLGLSIWFTLWNMIMSLMTASDVVVLGVFKSVNAVTSYSLTKYAPETTVSIIAIVVFGILPGLGGIIGSGDFVKARALRNEIMAFTWWICTAFGATILAWNRTFVTLWIGPEHFAGTVECFVILTMVTQFVILRNDANIIDLTLKLPRKVILGLISVAISIGAAVLAVSIFQAGIIGLCLGIMLGRMILSIGYPYIVGKNLGIPLKNQLLSCIRPFIVILLFFILASYASEVVYSWHWNFPNSWIGLLLGLAVSLPIFLILALFIGLTKKQRNGILRRLSRILTPHSAGI